jgi:hypothetical protein
MRKGSRRPTAIVPACVALFAALSTVTPTAFAADPALDKIIACMRGNIPKTVRIQAFEITAWDRGGGERTMRGKLYGTREDDRVRIMLRIEAPPDLSGAAYLVREGQKFDEMYLYVPAMKKVRRITGQSLDGQLWGTDLSYNDVKQIQNSFAAANASLVGTAQYQQRPVHVLSFAPRKEDASRYREIRTQVDAQTCVALQVDFVEPAGIRKTVTVRPADLKQANGLWYASEADIKDVRNLTHTRIKVTGVSSGDKLATRYFNPSSFYEGN